MLSHLEAARRRGAKGIPGTSRDKLNFGELFGFLRILRFGALRFLLLGSSLRLVYGVRPLVCDHGRRDLRFQFSCGHSNQARYVNPNWIECLSLYSMDWAPSVQVSATRVLPPMEFWVLGGSESSENGEKVQPSERAGSPTFIARNFSRMNLLALKQSKEFKLQRSVPERKDYYLLEVKR